MRYQEDLAGYLKMKRVKKMDLNIYVLGILFDLKNFKKKIKKFASGKVVGYSLFCRILNHIFIYIYIFI